MVTRDEVDRLQQKQACQASCEHCGLSAGLDERERIWLAQVLRDLTKLALGARKQALERVLRNLSEGQLNQVEAESNRMTGMPVD